MPTQENVHVDMSKINILNALLSKYKDVVLGVDIMFVNKVPYLVSISWHIKFITLEMIKNQNKHTGSDFETDHLNLSKRWV